jgi:hypothetical protein
MTTALEKIYRHVYSFTKEYHANLCLKEIKMPTDLGVLIREAKEHGADQSDITRTIEKARDDGWSAAMDILGW